MRTAQGCGGLDDPRNADCADAVQWAYEKGIKTHPGATEAQLSMRYLLLVAMPGAPSSFLLLAEKNGDENHVNDWASKIGLSCPQPVAILVSCQSSPVITPDCLVVESRYRTDSLEYNKSTF